MRTLIASIVTLALAASPAHADETRALKVSGAVLTAAGVALAVVGGALLIDYERKPPIAAFCGPAGCPNPYANELNGGIGVVVSGAAVAGTGVALLVVARGREHRRVALSASALSVSF